MAELRCNWDVTQAVPVDISVALPTDRHNDNNYEVIVAQGDIIVPFVFLSVSLQNYFQCKQPVQ